MPNRRQPFEADTRSRPINILRSASTVKSARETFLVHQHCHVRFSRPILEDQRRNGARSRRRSRWRRRCNRRVPRRQGAREAGPTPVLQTRKKVKRFPHLVGHTIRKHRESLKIRRIFDSQRIYSRAAAGTPLWITRRATLSIRLYELA